MNSDNTPEVRKPGQPPASWSAAQPLRPIGNTTETAPPSAQAPSGEASAIPSRAEASQPAKGPPGAKQKAAVVKTELARFEQRNGQKILFSELDKGDALLLEIKSEFGTFE